MSTNSTATGTDSPANPTDTGSPVARSRLWVVVGSLPSSLAVVVEPTGRAPRRPVRTAVGVTGAGRPQLRQRFAPRRLQVSPLPPSPTRTLHSPDSPAAHDHKEHTPQQPDDQPRPERHPHRRIHGHTLAPTCHVTVRLTTVSPAEAAACAPGRPLRATIRRRPGRRSSDCRLDCRDEANHFAR